MSSGVVTVAASPSTRLRFSAYFRMGRTIRFENWLGTLLWWGLVPGTIATDARTIVLLVLTLATYVAAVAVAGTLDDVQGFRDGSDAANYTRSDPTGLRPMTRKPLLLGWVTEGQAIAYARRMAGVFIVVDVTAWLVAGRTPWWYLAVHLGLFLLGSQYSYGLKLSYHGAQEALLLAGVVSTVLLPYALVTGHTSASAAVLGLLYAAWFVLVSSFSNRHDVEGDRHAARHTTAVLLSSAGHGRFIGALFVGTAALSAVAVAVGWLSPWTLLAFGPVAVLQGRAVVVGVARENPLRARQLGFWAVRLGVPSLFVVNAGVNWR